MTKAKSAAFLWMCVLVVAAPVGGSEPLTIRVSPVMAFAPAFLMIRASVQADDDNRTLEIVAESADFYRSSQIQLDGWNAPRVAVFEFRSLPSGLYQVTGILGGTRGRRAVVSRVVNVVPSAGAR